MVIVMNVWYVDYRLSSAPDPISCAKSCALKDESQLLIHIPTIHCSEQHTATQETIVASDLFSILNRTLRRVLRRVFRVRPYRSPPSHCERRNSCISGSRIA